MSALIDETEKEEKVELNPERDGLICRFYENEYPETDEVVIVNVTDLNDACAYVTLLEYKRKFWMNKATREIVWQDPAEVEEGDTTERYEEGREPMKGMILLSELSRRRIRSIHKLIRVGRTEIVKVISVDAETGFVNLSKRAVEPEDVGKCEERYNKAKAVHGAFCYVAAEKSKHLQEPSQKRQVLEDMYTSIGWPLYKKYSHAFDAFKMALSPESDEDIFRDIVVDEPTKQSIMQYVSRKLAAKEVRIRAFIEVTCYTYEGIDAIKEALLVGIESSKKTPEDEEAPVKIKLIAPPVYVMTITAMDKQIGIDAVNRAIEVVRGVITAKGGALVVKEEPKSVTIDESEQAMMERMKAVQEEAEEEDDDEPDS